MRAMPDRIPQPSFPRRARNPAISSPNLIPVLILLIRSLSRYSGTAQQLQYMVKTDIQSLRLSVRMQSIQSYGVNKSFLVVGFK